MYLSFFALPSLVRSQIDSHACASSHNDVVAAPRTMRAEVSDYEVGKKPRLVSTATDTYLVGRHAFEPPSLNSMPTRLGQQAPSPSRKRTRRQRQPRQIEVAQSQLGNALRSLAWRHRIPFAEVVQIPGPTRR